MIDYTLKKGSHGSREEGMCAMEWVAYLAGEEHSDAPVCVDPPLQAFGISLNDRWDDEQRQKLRPELEQAAADHPAAMARLTALYGPRPKLIERAA